MPSETHKTYRGYLYITAAALCWAVAATLGRAAFTGRLLPGGQALRPIDPLILSQSRTTFAFFIFFTVLALGRGWRRLRISSSDVWRILLLGVLGIAASNYFYYLAIQKTNVATAIILQYTAPVWVLLYMVGRKLQKATPQRVFAVALALAGIAMVIGIFSAGGLRLDLAGVIAGFLAAFAFAFYNIRGHHIVSRYDHWLVLLYTTLFASLFWLAINPPWKIVAAQYSGGQWLFLLIFSIVSALAPFSFYFAALKYLEPTHAIVVSCLEPVLSVVIAALVLQEKLGLLQVVGIVLVLAAILVVQMPNRSARPIAVVEPIE